MSALREWVSRLWGTLRRQRADLEWEEELRLHLELAAEDARRRGDSPDRAARTARLRAGGRSQAMEALRDQRGVPWLEDLARDLRLGLHGLKRQPAFAATAVLTLALGIGANTAVFSVVNAVLLRPLPYPQPDRLVSAGYLMTGEYLVLRDHARTVQAMALYQQGVGLNLSGDDEAVRLTGAYVSANFFSTLGTAAIFGRTFRPEEEVPGQNAVVVLSHGLWRHRFGEDASIVGRDVLVDSEPRTVVGVMPPGFDFPSSGTQLWIPYDTFDRGNRVALWGGGGGEVVARLGPAATPGHVQAELRALGPELRKANTLWVFPPDRRADLEVVPLQDRLVGEVRTRLLVILGAVGCVLLIACANVASLLLARASARQREVAIRHTLGARRSRLVRQFLTESAVLGLLGGAVGLALAFWGVRLLVGVLPTDIPRAEAIAVDGWVLGFTLVISVLTGVGFGAIPAIRSSGADVQGSLKTAERGSSASFGRAANVLVVGEIAAAVLLVIGAGLLIRSFAELLRVDPGFRTERIVAARLTPPESRYDTPARQRTFYEEVMARVQALPGVQDVEAVSGLPLARDAGGFAFETEDNRSVPGEYSPGTGDRRITPGYLRTMGIALLRGRALADTDREGTPRVAVINETMAREHWPGEDPIGKRFKEVWVDEWTTVVGVVRDVKQGSLAREVSPEVYRPFLQLPAPYMSLVVRTSHDPVSVTGSLREALAAVDPAVPVSEIRTVDQIVSSSLAASRFTTLLLAAFAAVALTLAAIGIYGVLSYTVSRRTREIGVRMAVGARGADVRRMVLRDALVLVCAGIVVGTGAALAATRVLETLLFGVRATDIRTFAMVPIVLVAVALVAAYVPASRATRVDPAATLLRPE